MTETQAVHAHQKWEYRAFTKQTEIYLLTELGEAGRDGWEMVSVSYNKDLKGIWGWTAFLKRPIVHGEVSPAKHAVGAAVPAEGQTAPAQPAAEDPMRGFQMTGDDFQFKAGE
jgi:hypothetical protein